ncbi:MAG: hypothetical protein ACLFQK_07950 [Fibrobacterota bacterium]
MEISDTGILILAVFGALTLSVFGVMFLRRALKIAAVIFAAAALAFFIAVKAGIIDEDRADDLKKDVRDKIQKDAEKMIRR